MVQCKVIVIIVTVCLNIKGKNPRNHPRWVPLNVIIKVNVEESPSRFTLEGLHDRAISEVVKVESPSMTTTE